jgi:small-conductance mechanosensitive channel/CRP-like cAMP-binding protein
MDIIRGLSFALHWAAAISILIYVGGSIAIGFLSKKSALLKPIGSGLKLIVLFAALQVFILFGGADRAPRVALQLNFFSWLLFIFAALRLCLYIYGDLFVVRWKRGSFPAAFKNIITVFVLLVSALLLLKEILDINVTSLIATTTVLTATIGLAFQGTLANMLAGLTIHLEKPLKQGDWIAVGGHEGRVMDITLRSTRILTIEQNEVFIPNSKVLSEAVVNYSLPGNVQVRKLSVGAAYSVTPNRVKQAILDVLADIPEVKKRPEPIVRVVNYGDFSVHYEFRYAIEDFSRHIEIEAEIMSLLWYRFKRMGIEIPMPVRDVNLRHITAEGLLAERERRTAEILSLMDRVEMLSALSREERIKLAEQVRQETYSAGEIIFRQDDPGDSFYIIKSGTVEVVVGKPGVGDVVVATLGPGNFFGEMSLLTGAVRTAGIRVRDDAEFFVIDKEGFGAALIRNPSIAESLSRILSERRAGLDAKRERLGSSAAERLREDDSGRMLSKIREFFGLNKR